MSKIVKRKDGYWIIGLPSNWPDHGPYDRKADAQDDEKGLLRMHAKHIAYWQKVENDRAPAES